MRKLIIVVLLVGLMVVGSFAQMNYGVKGGLTLGKVSTDDVPSSVDRKFRMGFAFGGMMVMPLNENMELQTELMYVMKGEKFEEGSFDMEIKMDVLEVPVLLKYKFAENMAAYGGISLDYIVSAKVEEEGYELDLLEEDLVKTFGMGLSFGAQYMMDKIIIDARYDLGLTNMVEDDFMTEEAKFNTIYLTVGYLF